MIAGSGPPATGQHTPPAPRDALLLSSQVPVGFRE